MSIGNSYNVLSIDFLCFYVLYANVILFYYVYCLYYAVYMCNVCFLATEKWLIGLYDFFCVNKRFELNWI